ncbi:DETOXIFICATION 46 protein [Nymphaea thermarum]|nr:DETOXIFICATION 46 protein [Nymphaea thermarum]
MAARATWGSHLPCLFLTSSRWHPAAFRSLKPFPLDSPLTRSRLRIRCCASPTIGRSDDGPKSTGSGEDGPGLAREEQIVGSAEGGHISVGGNLQGGIWQQVKDIAMFAAPATGLWLCSPMMSLIDTAVVGQSSAVELAALAFIGPKNSHIVPAASSYIQFIGAVLMIDSLNKSGFSAFRLSIPSPSELLQIVELAAPVFITMFSKVAFYSFLTYFATSMGTITLAAHQVFIETQFNMLKVPCSTQARMLLQSLVTIGIIAGCMLTTIGTVVPWLFPYIFTSDLGVSSEMRTVLLPYSVAILITPPTLSLEGTLLAGRDLAFLSLSMISCFCLGVLLLVRFLAAFRRLTSPQSMLFSTELIKKNLGELKAT